MFTVKRNKSNVLRIILAFMKTACGKWTVKLSSLSTTPVLLWKFTQTSDSLQLSSLHQTKILLCRPSQSSPLLLPCVHWGNPGTGSNVTLRYSWILVRFEFTNSSSTWHRQVRSNTPVSKITLNYLITLYVPHPFIGIIYKSFIGSKFTQFWCCVKSAIINLIK